MIWHVLGFTLVTLLCWRLLPRAVGAQGRPAPGLEPRLLLLVVLLYAVPLPLAVVFGSEGGDLSEDIGAFQPWLPEALWFTALFMAVFTAAMRSFDRRAGPGRAALRVPTAAESRRFGVLSVLAGLLCLALLQLLAADVGGLLELVLSGYKVTELLVEKGHLAVAFDWLVALSALATSFAIASGRRTARMAAAVLTGALILALGVMGRRGMLAVVLLSQAWLALEAGWIRRPGRLVLPGFIAFLALNWLGLVRGESYDGMAELTGTLVSKTAELAASGELAGGLFYTLTHGNFVVPFETLPQLMRHLAHSSDYWYGASVPRGALLLVPGALLPDRPLPLANWYMTLFYGGGASNEGRQFFFLSEAWLDFGWFGALAWGVLVAWLLARFARPRQGEFGYAGLALRALFFGSVLSFVASDTTGFFAAFLKGPALLPLLFAGADRLLRPRHG